MTPSPGPGHLIFRVTVTEGGNDDGMDDDQVVSTLTHLLP